MRALALDAQSSHSGPMARSPTPQELVGVRSPRSGFSNAAVQRLVLRSHSDRSVKSRLESLELEADQRSRRLVFPLPETFTTGRYLRPGLLPPVVGTELGNQLGRELGQVRLHSGPDVERTSAAIGADAFALRRDVFVGNRHVDLASRPQVELLSHELVHVLQHVEGRVDPRLQLLRRAKPRPRPVERIRVKWTGSTYKSLFDYIRAFVRTDDEAVRITHEVLTSAEFEIGGRTVTQEQFEAAGGSYFDLTEAASAQLRERLGMTVREMEIRKRVSEMLPGIEELSRGLPSGRESTEGREYAEPIQASWSVLEHNGELGKRYLYWLEHFAGLHITLELERQAATGFTAEQITRLAGGDPELRYYTSLVAQGYQEFKAGGGIDIDSFTKLEGRILEQVKWGNPTAVHNRLMIGLGRLPFGEHRVQQLGILDRRSRGLLYDKEANALRWPGSSMPLDEGYVGAAPPEGFYLDIGKISDDVIRGIFNQLRIQVGEPNRLVVQAALVYKQNSEEVNAIVKKGLLTEIGKKFIEALPMFGAFIIGNALSSWLIRTMQVPLVAAGTLLKGLILAAEYAMDLDFVGSAMSRLYESAQWLARVGRDKEGKIDHISQRYLELAAVPLRSVVADVAMMAGLKGIGKLVRAIRGKQKMSLECTECKLEVGKKEAKGAEEAGKGEEEGGRKKGGVSVDVWPDESEALERMREIVNRKGKWSDLSSEDRSALGRLFHRVVESLASYIFRGIGRAYHGTEITPSLIARLRRSGGRVLFTEAGIRIEGQLKRIDILELNFDRDTGDLIDLVSKDMLDHVEKTRGYKAAVRALTGFSIKALEMRYIGEDMTLQDKLIEFLVRGQPSK